ncbi:hypothetical protein U1Q18_045957 [Sarracenia purpurea var. burkii]
MASLSVAIGLWNYATVSPAELPTDDYHTREWRGSISELVSDNWEEQLPLPKSFMLDINNQFYWIKERVNGWISYHFEKMFCKEGNDCVLFHHLYCIVWHPNGAVNYYKTALNMLKSDKLGDLEKYRLACTYCLKEEIEKLWSSVENEPSIDEEFSQNNPLISYWNCYCADKLHVLPVDGDLSIDEFIFRQTDVDNWAAIEYFFDRLNAEQQIAAAIHFINRDDYKFQKLIIMKMNESQRLQVKARKAVRIIQNYLRDGGAYLYANERSALATWYEVRNLITEAQFVALLNRLCRAKPSVKSSILMEIWTSSHDKFKLHLINRPHYDFIGDVFRWASRMHQSRLDFLDFLFAVLQEGTKVGFKPLDQWTFVRRTFFYRLCAGMTGDGEVDLITRLLNICVPSAKDCAKIKQHLTKRTSAFTRKTFINQGCVKLINKYDFQKLDEFLKFFFPENIPKSRQILRDLLLRNLTNVDSYCLNFYLDGKVKELNDWLSPLKSSYPEVILEYKKYLLSSNRGVQACYSHLNSETGDVLAEIVADGFPEKKDATTFGRKIIFSDEGICKLQSLICDESVLISIVKRSINLCLKWTRDKKKLERKLNNYVITDPRVKERYLQVLFECGISIY